MPRIRAVVFDLAGTVCDRYSLAPAFAFKNLFQMFGITCSMRTIRAPMGKAKRDHLSSILFDPTIHADWRALYKRNPSENDVERLYQEFIPVQLATITKHAKIIDGADKIFKTLRGRGVKIGATTGYPKEIVDVLSPLLEEQGLEFDTIVATDEVENGRPYPDMIFENMKRLEIDNASEVLKVDDCSFGILEGIKAKCFTLGVSAYSNHVGIDSVQEALGITSESLQVKRNNASNILRNAGADYIVDTIESLPEVLYDLKYRK